MPRRRSRHRLAALSGAAAVALVCASVAGAGWSAGAVAGPQTIAAGSIEAPGSLSAAVSCVPNTSMSVALTWPASANATEYDVRRATASGGPYATIGTTAAPSFVDSTVTQLTGYHYVITAKRGAWTSAPSPQASATTPRQANCR